MSDILSMLLCSMYSVSSAYLITVRYVLTLFHQVIPITH